MTRAIHASPSVVRFAPVGIDARDGSPDEMIFTTEYGGAFNVRQTGTITNMNLNVITLPSGLTNPYYLVRGRCIRQIGSPPAGWVRTSSPGNSGLWLTAMFQPQSREFSFFNEEIDTNGNIYRLEYFPEVWQGTIRVGVEFIGGPTNTDIEVEFQVQILDNNI